MSSSIIIIAHDDTLTTTAMGSRHTESHYHADVGSIVTLVVCAVYANPFHSQQQRCHDGIATVEYEC